LSRMAVSLLVHYLCDWCSFFFKIFKPIFALLITFIVMSKRFCL